MTNITVSLGFVTEHPRARMKVDGGTSTPMDPGPFILPHFHLAIPLPFDFAFGLGFMPEYGLGSAYDNGWELENNSLDTTVQSFTINPNLAYKITDDWSVGLGLRFLYFDFDQHAHPTVSSLGYSRFRNHLHGDNSMGDLGYQVGTKYDIFDNFSVGVVYKSLTVVNVEGETENVADNQNFQKYASAASGSAKTDLELPQSITGGFNWDITDTVHLGGLLGWSQWSAINTLIFDLAGTKKYVNLHWNDTWRAGLAPSWDFAEDWTLMGSYVFENDCASRQDSTMLPAAHRHMLTTGLAWRCWRGLELALSYGMILMDGVSTQATNGYGVLSEYAAYRGISHAVGFTLTYRF